MWYILSGFLLSVIWIAYEMWRAPVGEETEDGFREIRPSKKFKDLFKNSPHDDIYS